MFTQKLDPESVLQKIQRSEQPLSVNELAQAFQVDWHTIKKKVDVLVKQNKVYAYRMHRNLTLYWHKPIFDTAGPHFRPSV